VDYNFLPKFPADYWRVGELKVRKFYYDREKKGSWRENLLLINPVPGISPDVSVFNHSSVTLVFQSALPVLLFAPHETKLVLRGGTDVQKSPAIDYTKYILLPFLKKHFGIECDLDVRKRGFSSHGGGEAFITISPLEYKLKCISLLDRGEVNSFTGIIWTARQEYQNVAHHRFSSVADNRSSIHSKNPSNLNLQNPTQKFH
jgi:RNA 3'-terminal phosphate cyclase